MLGSAAFHLTRHEYANVALSLILIVMCALVAYGRLESLAIPSIAIG